MTVQHESQPFERKPNISPIPFNPQPSSPPTTYIRPMIAIMPMIANISIYVYCLFEMFEIIKLNCSSDRVYCNSLSFIMQGQTISYSLPPNIIRVFWFPNNPGTRRLLLFSQTDVRTHLQLGQGRNCLMKWIHEWLFLYAFLHDLLLIYIQKLAYL